MDTSAALVRRTYNTAPEGVQIAFLLCGAVPLRRSGDIYSAVPTIPPVTVSLWLAKIWATPKSWFLTSPSGVEEVRWFQIAMDDAGNHRRP